MAGNELTIGILGGSFDPVHKGHLSLADHALEQLHLNQLLMIPVGNPPHKPKGILSEGHHRLEMLKRAVLSDPRIQISTLELDKEGVSYTAETLRLLRGAYGESAEFTLIIGADQLMDLETWREVGAILKDCTIAVAVRPGIDNQLLFQQMEYLAQKYQADIQQLQAPPLAISATEIRQKIQAGDPVSQWLPEPVIQYIHQNQLYTG